MAKLNEAAITKTMAAADTVVLTLADGKIARISKADLVEAIRAVMPVATTAANGLMSATDKVDIAERYITVSGVQYILLGKFKYGHNSGSCFTISIANTLTSMSLFISFIRAWEDSPKVFGAKLIAGSKGTIFGDLYLVANGDGGISDTFSLYIKQLWGAGIPTRVRFSSIINFLPSELSYTSAITPAMTAVIS